jgi:AmmeMemoRadiSam system protein A
MEDRLTEDERSQLLKLAREALTCGVNGQVTPDIDLKELPARLRVPGASFVTLTRKGNLRGCIGTLEARRPLAEDVCEHAVAAAMQDYRFAPVHPDELPEIQIEISRLTTPVRIDYSCVEELIMQLRPGVDGVVLMDGVRRATFLPQVWEKIPEPERFLDHLCWKMGAPPDLWRSKKLDVLVYQVEEFQEQSE